MEKEKKDKTGFRDRLEDMLRSACGRLTPDKRLIIVITFIIVGSIGSIYLTVKSIYNMGKNSAERDFMEIKHIEMLELPDNDSNNFNYNDYGTEQEFGTEEAE